MNNEWITLTSEGEYMTCKMPHDQQSVEIKLSTGATHDALFEKYGSEDWWFELVDQTGCPTGEPLDSFVVAWRPLTTEDTSHD